MIAINKLKKGDYFKLNDKGRTVYVYDGYNRSTKKYEAYKFDDIGAFREFKKGRLIFTDFTF